MELILQHPFEWFVAICVVIVTLTRGLGWGVFVLYALLGIAIVIKMQGFGQFAGGVIAGVVANEFTHLLRNKLSKTK